MWTAVKKAENTSFVYTQATPRPVKKIILYDQQKHKHLYELVNDRDVGIYSQYQNIVIKSVTLIILSTMTTTSRRQAPSFKGEWCRPSKICTPFWTRWINRNDVWTKWKGFMLNQIEFLWIITKILYSSCNNRHIIVKISNNTIPIILISRFLCVLLFSPTFGETQTSNRKCWVKKWHTLIFLISKVGLNQ